MTLKNISGIICIEGPDGVGKTTLADYFVEEFGALNLHATYRFRKMIPAYHEALLRRAEAWAADGGLAILDRHWVTEAIYARVFRGGTQWPQYTKDMDVRFKNAGVMTVLCLPNSIEESLERRKRRDVEDPENLEREKPVNKGKAYSEEQMIELFKRYMDFWRGNMFAEGEDQVAELTRTGGVCDREDYMQYRIEVEGAKTEFFVRGVLKKLHWLQVALEKQDEDLQRK
jgi:thymidylate kinase